VPPPRLRTRAAAGEGIAVDTSYPGSAPGGKRSYNPRSAAQILGAQYDPGDVHPCPANDRQAEAERRQRLGLPPRLSAAEAAGLAMAMLDYPDLFAPILRHILRQGGAGHGRSR
jgi:hypothetical protein